MDEQRLWLCTVVKLTRVHGWCSRISVHYKYNIKDKLVCTNTPFHRMVDPQPFLFHMLRALTQYQHLPSQVPNQAFILINPRRAVNCSP